MEARVKTFGIVLYPTEDAFDAVVHCLRSAGFDAEVHEPTTSDRRCVWVTITRPTTGETGDET